jgi:hypothetical protein
MTIFYMKPSFKYNSNGVKYSSDQYRNIKGVHFSHWTSDTSEFEEAKKIAAESGLKVRIIRGELYMEKNPTSNNN